MTASSAEAAIGAAVMPAVVAAVEQWEAWLRAPAEEAADLVRPRRDEARHGTPEKKWLWHLPPKSPA